MAKSTATAITDEMLLEEVQAELDGMTSDELDRAASTALLQQEVRKAKTRARTMSAEQKERNKIYNRKRNLRMKLLAQKAEEAGVVVSEEEVESLL